MQFGGGGRHQREGEPGERIEAALTALFTETLAPAFAVDDPVQVSIACAKFLAWFFRIHPFADGNGRLGRSLIALLCRRGGRFELRWASGDPAGQLVGGKVPKSRQPVRSAAATASSPARVFGRTAVAVVVMLVSPPTGSAPPGHVSARRYADQQRATTHRADAHLSKRVLAMGPRR